MKTRTLESSLWVPGKPGEIFPFFAEADNLDAITPRWLKFRVLTPLPVEMSTGVRIDYKLSIRGIPVRWQSEITHWEPPLRFVDVQRRGPYRIWEHEHIFEAVDGGTMIRDRVRYQAPGWILEPVLHRFLVGPDLEEIFEYRRSSLMRALRSTHRRPDPLRSGNMVEDGRAMGAMTPASPRSTPTE